MLNALTAETPLQGRFRVARPLRADPDRETYLVLDESQGDTCTLELFGPTTAAAERRDDFHRAARALGAVSGDHLAELRGWGYHGQRPWLIWRACAGGSVDEWVDLHGPMPEGLALDVVVDAARGVGLLHQAGVVHGDLRPANVLIDLDGRCRVARAARASLLAIAGLELRAPRAADGSVAPEQLAELASTRAAAREPGAPADPRADLYGLGALLYSLVSGRAPGSLHLAGPRHSRYAALSAPLVDVIVHCTRSEPDQRLEDVGALLARLAGIRRLVPPVPSSTPSLVAAGWQSMDGPLADLDASLPPAADPLPPGPLPGVWTRLKGIFG